MNVAPVAPMHTLNLALQGGGQHPRQSARDSLKRIWGEISNLGALGDMHQRMAGLLWGGLPPELAPANIMTLACLPILFRTVEIDGEGMARYPASTLGSTDATKISKPKA